MKTIFMVRVVRTILSVGLLAFGLERAAAFSLIGPFESWQTPVLTYQVGGDLGGPMNIGEEYRRNTPVMYFSFNENFINYYGSNGIHAVEEAFAILNGLTNVSSYSRELNEFPLEAQRFNFRAQSASLTDLKSFTLAYLMEQLGLAEPDRYAWTLRERSVGPAPGCPDNVGYQVIKRNYEVSPTSLDVLQPSSYVNGTLYTYGIVEFCQNTPFLADAVEVLVDPLANPFTAIAAKIAPFGSFYTGLTRDDVAGLRYLLRTNNYNFEDAGPGTITYVTNNTPQLLYSSNLTVLAQAALTNDAGTLAALFPGLAIGNSSYLFTNVVTTRTVSYFTNLPTSPVGTPPTLVRVQVVETNILTYYTHQFLNVYTNVYATSGPVTVLITNVTRSACPPLTPVGTVCSNVSLITYTTNGVFGDYLLFPTNACDLSIIRTQLIVSVSQTNPPVIATNTGTVTNTQGQFYSESTINTFNQYIFVVNPVLCLESNLSLNQGIEQVRFVRRDFDSLLGRFFYPITNEYSLTMLTNNGLVPQRVERFVGGPDLLFDAQDLGNIVVPPSIGAVTISRNLGISTATASPGLNGPGTIETATIFTFNKLGPTYFNLSPLFLDESTASVDLIWGSFDGSTNAPVVYPNGTSIENIENQLLIQVSPVGPALPTAVLGVNYTNIFVAHRTDPQRGHRRHRRRADPGGHV
jgi:hypothetical protein